MAVGLTVLQPATANAALSGCGAHLIGNIGGHSYCASGGSNGVQRVKVYCDPPWSSTIKLRYGPWRIAKQWSEAYCNGYEPAVQAQYQLA